MSDRYKELIIGESYIVSLHDCCLEATFTAKLIDMDISEHMFEKFIFDIGRAENTASSRLEFEKVEHGTTT